jgi:cyclic beta-1,2-glucan synthetase
MYQTAVESLLGLRRHGTTFSVDPCIPAMWPQFSLEWRYGTTRYHINVTNPEHECCGVRSAELDGVAADARALPLVDDGATHTVTVVIGRAATVEVQSRSAGVIRSTRT